MGDFSFLKVYSDTQNLFILRPFGSWAIMVLNGKSTCINVFCPVTSRFCREMVPILFALVKMYENDKGFEIN